jgi:hypothetical protein
MRHRRSSSPLSLLTSDELALVADYNEARARQYAEEMSGEQDERGQFIADCLLTCRQERCMYFREMSATLAEKESEWAERMLAT